MTELPMVTYIGADGNRKHLGCDGQVYVRAESNQCQTCGKKTEPEDMLTVDPPHKRRLRLEYRYGDTTLTQEQHDQVKQGTAERSLVIVTIGNSDNKLSQKDWSDFFNHVREVYIGFNSLMHGAWHSIPNEPWQNACFSGEVYTWLVDEFKRRITFLARKYQQDSVVFIDATGKVEML